MKENNDLNNWIESDSNLLSYKINIDYDKFKRIREEMDSKFKEELKGDREKERIKNEIIESLTKDSRFKEEIEKRQYFFEQVKKRKELEEKHWKDEDYYLVKLEKLVGDDIEYPYLCKWRFDFVLYYDLIPFEDLEKQIENKLRETRNNDTIVVTKLEVHDHCILISGKSKKVCLF